MSPWNDEVIDMLRDADHLRALPHEDRPALLARERAPLPVPVISGWPSPLDAGRCTTPVRTDHTDGHDGAPKILLVEDNALNADMLSRRLKRRGFVVVIASDGLEAVKLAKREQPDLILMDLGLPGIDGCEATRRIKSATATSAVPVIALTAHAMANDRDQAFLAGCEELETKPVDLERLLAKMAAALAVRPIAS